MPFCQHCGKEISSSKHQKKFCNRSCAAKFNNSKRKLSEETKAKIRASVLTNITIYTKQCDCGVSFQTGSNRSRRCKTCQSLKRVERDNKRGRAKNACPVCGKPAVNIFCSRGCSHQNRRLETAQRIESGSYSIASTTLETLRRYLFRVRGRRCEICSLTEWQNRPIPVEVDHINGNCRDHSITNLRLVCGNCAMQLPTYKSKNKGNSKRGR